MRKLALGNKNNTRQALDDIERASQQNDTAEDTIYDWRRVSLLPADTDTVQKAIDSLAGSVTTLTSGTFSSTVTATGYKVLGVQVVGPRRTGWAAATNTKLRTAFDTTTVTTAQLAARVGALIDDLIAHGLIGP